MYSFSFFDFLGEWRVKFSPLYFPLLSLLFSKTITNMNKILIKRKSELSLELSNEMKKKKKDRNQKQIDSLKTCISNISKWLKQ